MNDHTTKRAPCSSSPAPLLVGSAAGAARWCPPDRRRLLQLALATIWLIDGLLQLQGFMFSSGFGRLMLAPMAQGNPSFVARSIHWAGIVISHHPEGFDTLFALIQISIGMGLALRRTTKAALAVSVVWATLIWWFGEGLGGILAGSANPITGAPGAVILYALLAVLLWPAGTRTVPGFVAASSAVGERAAKTLWALVWMGLAVMALVGPNRSGTYTGSLIREEAPGEPGWLASFDHHVASAAGHSGLAIATVLALVFVAVAGSVFVSPTAARVGVVVAVAVAAVIWVAGENFGGIFTGSGTDPNSGPLLMLLAAAYWPLARPAPLITLAPAVGAA